MAKTRNRGSPRTPAIIEEFVEFLYTVKGLSYEDISYMTGLASRTIIRIAKRKGFQGARGEPQTIEDALKTVDSSFTASVAAVNDFMIHDLDIDDQNVHKHIGSQKDMVEIRRGVIESSTYHNLKAAIEAHKGFETWIETTDTLSDEQRHTALEVLRAYQHSKTNESIKILTKLAR